MTKTTKLFAVVAAVAIVLGLVFAPVAKAQTVDINTLLAQIQALTAQLNALKGGSTVSTGYVFSTNLTVGSKGADVSALQAKLGVSPATGYFGAITKAAVAAYQAEKGINATGYVGPLTRAALNAAAPVVTPTTGGTTVTPVVTTTGQEGTLTLTSSNAGTASSLYEGDTQDAILGLKLEAKTSDITVQRIKLDLGATSAIYNKVLSKIYVKDGSNVIASSDLNSSTVVKEGGEYFITLTGFNVVVAKDTTKVLTIAVDVRPSVDSTERSVVRTIQTASSAVRGTDGAGINQYTSDTAGIVTKSFTINSTLVDSASLKISLNSASPAATTIIAADGTNNNEVDKVPGLIFNVKAEKDNVLINEMTVNATGTAVAAGEITAVYLYDGSNEIDNTSTFAANGDARFSNVDLTVSKDTTKVLTVKFDVRNATTSAKTITVSVPSVTSTTVDAENSNGDTVTSAFLSGSATADQLQVQTAGAVYTFGSATLTKTAIGNTASSSYLASFNFKVGAQGSDLTVASTGAFVVGIYVNNVQVATTSAVYAKPTSGVTGTSPYTIADGAEATFVAEYSFTAPAGVYTSGIVNARLESATTNLGTATYISDTFRTNSSTI